MAMTTDHLTSTATHEAAHAVLSYVLAQRIRYLELLDERNGRVFLYESPCQICGNDVRDGWACQNCLAYYESNDPVTDERSSVIERAYRVEAAIAAAGEIAELHLNNGVLLASCDELCVDRDRVLSRSALRHLWRDDACNKHRSEVNECAVCRASADSLRAAVTQLLTSPAIWAAVLRLAARLCNERHVDGHDVEQVLRDQSLPVGAELIDDLWPALTAR